MLSLLYPSTSLVIFRLLFLQKITFYNYCYDFYKSKKWDNFTPMVSWLTHLKDHFKNGKGTQISMNSQENSFFIGGIGVNAWGHQHLLSIYQSKARIIMGASDYCVPTLHHRKFVLKNSACEFSCKIIFLLSKIYEFHKLFVFTVFIMT